MLVITHQPQPQLPACLLSARDLAAAMHRIDIHITATAQSPSASMPMQARHISRPLNGYHKEAKARHVLCGSLAITHNTCTTLPDLELLVKGQRLPGYARRHHCSGPPFNWAREQTNRYVRQKLLWFAATQLHAPFLNLANGRNQSLGNQLRKLPAHAPCAKPV